MNEFYCIRNTVNEYDLQTTGYYRTLEDAKAALRHKEDWWASKGTGRIYKIKFNKEKDSYVEEELVYRVR